MRFAKDAVFAPALSPLVADTVTTLSERSRALFDTCNKLNSRIMHAPWSPAKLIKNVLQVGRFPGLVLPYYVFEILVFHTV